MNIVEQVEAVVADVIPPAGRADLTNPQKVALGQVVALAHLAEQQRIANLLTVLGGSAGMVEHAAYMRGMTDDGKPASTGGTSFERTSGLLSGSMAEGDQEWVQDEASRVRVAEALAEIDRAQAVFPSCRACGQRTGNPSGVCSKKTPEHDRLVVELGWRR